MKEKVLEVLEKIRPLLQNEGSDVEFIALTDDNILQICIQGRGKTCPSARKSLKNLISKYMLRSVPELGGIETLESSDTVNNIKK